MTDPREQITEAKGTIATWQRTPDATVQRVEQTGWTIYLATVIAAVAITAVVSSGLTYVFLWAWSNDWEVAHASGRSEKCSRAHGGLFATPHYVCVEHP